MKFSAIATVLALALAVGAGALPAGAQEKPKASPPVLVTSLGLALMHFKFSCQ
jgi:hypothetical protein